MVLNERAKSSVFSLTNHKVCVLKSDEEKQMWVCLPGGTEAVLGTESAAQQAAGWPGSSPGLWLIT